MVEETGMSKRNPQPLAREMINILKLGIATRQREVCWHFSLHRFTYLLTMPLELYCKFYKVDF